MKEQYKKFIHKNRPVDTKHTPMSLHNRAAQFAPFDALTGFGGRIYEAARLTEPRITLSDERKQEINEQLLFLEQHLEEHPVITITYFEPDLRKKGGSYKTITAAVQKIKLYEERLLLDEDISIAFDDIFDITIIS